MSQEGKPDFYTQKGYQMRSQHALTGAMEDYLEMICRQAEADGCARIGLLAEGLNVRPSSASKMVYQLRTLGLVAFEKYGLIQPTEKGWSVGRWLLHRHEVLHRFFCMLHGRAGAGGAGGALFKRGHRAQSGGPAGAAGAWGGIAAPSGPTCPSFCC